MREARSWGVGAPKLPPPSRGGGGCLMAFGAAAARGMVERRGGERGATWTRQLDAESRARSTASQCVRDLRVVVGRLGVDGHRLRRGRLARGGAGQQKRDALHGIDRASRADIHLIHRDIGRRRGV